MASTWLAFPTVSDHPWLSTTLKVAGGIYLGKIAVKTVWRMYTATVAMCKNDDLKARYQHRNGQPSWAVVTGGSEGLGRSYAHALAAQGFHICIVALDNAQLKATCEEIKLAYPDINVRPVGVDLTDPSASTVIAQATQDLDIAMLINNAGVAPQPQLLESYNAAADKQAALAMDINVKAAFMILRTLVPVMVARGCPGGIINMSSASSIQGLPWSSVYAGTKAFNHAVSLSLSSELRRHKIDVLSVRPWFVATPMTNLKPSATIPTPEAVVKAALGKLGHVDECVGVFAHEVHACLMQALPRVQEGIMFKALQQTRAQIDAREA
eukprot:m.25907 g.25907  ORF g.25907 m.25907 type:complete len:325 (-) comp11641_c0_seq1:88-1062(-)